MLDNPLTQHLFNHFIDSFATKMVFFCVIDGLVSDLQYLLGLGSVKLIIPSYSIP